MFWAFIAEPKLGCNDGLSPIVFGERLVISMSFDAYRSEATPERRKYEVENTSWEE
jgi:hypothetical protein